MNRLLMTIYVIAVVVFGVAVLNLSPRQLIGYLFFLGIGWVLAFGSGREVEREQRDHDGPRR